MPQQEHKYSHGVALLGNEVFKQITMHDLRVVASMCKALGAEACWRSGLRSGVRHGDEPRFAPECLGTVPQGHDRSLSEGRHANTTLATNLECKPGSNPYGMTL